MLDFGTLKSLKIAGIDLVRLTINGVLAWKKGYKNWAFNSLESGGASIYNGGLGYKTGYRVRSGGAEGEGEGIIITGFIPFQNGDTLRFYPKFNGGNTWNTLNFSDGNFTNLGQMTDSGAAYGICIGNTQYYKSSVINGISTLTLSSPNEEIRYVRVGLRYQDSGVKESTMNNQNGVGCWVKNDLSNFIVTVNEEFEVPA